MTSGRPAEAIDAELRAVYAALPFGVAFVTPDLRYERVNEALARINGVPVEAHIGRTVREVMGEHADAAERITREVIESGAPRRYELAVRTTGAPEEERIFETLYFPVSGPGEELLGVGAIVRDVTERRRLEDEREAALRRAAFLATVTTRLAASMDYEATLREVVASAVPTIADWCLVTVVEAGSRLRLLALAHRDPERERLAGLFSAAYSPSGASTLTEVMRTRRPVIETDVPRERLAALLGEGESLEMVERLGVRHFGTWPIRAPQGELLGTLSLVLGDSGRRFSDEDLELARVLATRAGLHIANARLHTERSEIARTLQASLLPREVPAIPGLDVASAFVPAAGEGIVGGDFYDVFATGEGVWTAILGDVAGKGAGAAAITATARNTLRAAALLEPDPAANLALLNQVLVGDRRGAEFCTVVQARLCPGEGGLSVRLASGGHPPALVLRRGGAVESVLEGRGPLVGIVAEAAFTETDLELGPGDLLLLYTDGVTEVRTSDLALGQRELETTLARHAGRPASEVAEAVTAGALRLQGGRGRDDIAVLAIRVPDEPSG